MTDNQEIVIFFNDMAFSQNPLPLWIQSCFIKAMFKIVISLKYRHFLSQLGWITRIRSLLVSFHFFARQISELVKQIKIPWGGFNLNLLLDELKNSGLCVRHLWRLLKQEIHSFYKLQQNDKLQEPEFPHRSGILCKRAHKKQRKIKAWIDSTCSEVSMVLQDSNSSTPDQWEHLEIVFYAEIGTSISIWMIFYLPLLWVNVKHLWFMYSKHDHSVVNLLTSEHHELSLAMSSLTQVC